MKSTTTHEELIAKIGYYEIFAKATKTVDDADAKVVASFVKIVGLDYTLEDVAKILEILPLAAERAGALAAKLRVEVTPSPVPPPTKSLPEPYATPEVKSVGNAREQLAEVCATEHESDHEQHDHELEPRKPTTTLRLPVLQEAAHVEEAPVKKSCAACQFSGMEPQDMDLTCFHPDAGPFGLHVLRGPAAHCPNYAKFKQHPSRNPDGTLKSMTEPSTST